MGVECVQSSVARLSSVTPSSDDSWPVSKDQGTGQGRSSIAMEPGGDPLSTWDQAHQCPPKHQRASSFRAAVGLASQPSPGSFRLLFDLVSVLAFACRAQWAGLKQADWEARRRACGDR